MQTDCCSHTALAWGASGRPEHGYSSEAVPDGTRCATCGADVHLVDGSAVHLSQIETPTTANHADFFRFGSKHLCSACAWLFNAGKGRPGNYIATPERFELAVISVESVVEDKRPWLAVLRDLQCLAPNVPVTGVMTTDVKPRLWPRSRLATRGAMGLYVHVPDWDVSEFRAFDLDACLQAIDVMLPMLAAGYAKASLYFGLLRDYARFQRIPSGALAWERELRALRSEPHFVPALIAAGVTKEAKSAIKPPAKRA
jgi:rubredoxin